MKQMQTRIRDFGISIGSLPTGPLNKITDVAGVTVGHCTVKEGPHQTGVTVILPSPKNPFSHKLPAASFVLNGFGKTQGLIQMDELGSLETPIALTNTLNVGLVHDALVEYMLNLCGRSVDVEQPGGVLHVEWDDQDIVHMTGPSHVVFEGEFYL